MARSLSACHGARQGGTIGTVECTGGTLLCYAQVTYAPKKVPTKGDLSIAAKCMSGLLGLAECNKNC
jgi:hypothetical protein